VNGGAMTASGWTNAAGAFAYNMNTGTMSLGNAGNAIAVHVGTINNNPL